MAGLRKTWDKAEYEAKAVARLERGDDIEDDRAKLKRKRAPEEAKEEFRMAAPDAAGPIGSQRAFIQARQDRVDIESKVGKTEIITTAEIEKGGGAGYYCEVCACLLKDSASYLDHINGKRHQRALGFSMRSERADVSAVQSRLALIKEKIEEKKSRPTLSSLDSYEARIAAQIADQELKKKQRKEAMEQRKQQEAELAEAAAAEDEDDNDDDGEGGNNDSDMAALMGFGGFGSSKK